MSTIRLLIHLLFDLLQDQEKEDKLPLQEVSVDDILEAQRKEQDTKQDQEKLLAKALKERGLQYIPDMSHDDMF